MFNILCRFLWIKTSKQPEKLIPGICFQRPLIVIRNLMKSQCDICFQASQKNCRQNDSIAQFIHLSNSHKISLLCQKCLSTCKDEIFYLPIGQNHNLQNAELNKYLHNISSNFVSASCSNLKVMVQQLFETKIWQPFRQLQNTILAYRNILTEYKKKVRAQYKAVMSKLDPGILKNFKQIILQIHEQSAAVQKFPRLTLQRQQLDIIITAMKISAQNQWPDLDLLIETTKRSYQKFRHVFTNENTQLSKKNSLLKKILARINIQNMYGKKYPDKRTILKNVSPTNTQNIVLISESEEQQQHSQGKQTGFKIRQSERIQNQGQSQPIEIEEQLEQPSVQVDDSLEIEDIRPTKQSQKNSQNLLSINQINKSELPTQNLVCFNRFVQKDRNEHNYQAKNINHEQRDQNINQEQEAQNYQKLVPKKTLNQNSKKRTYPPQYLRNLNDQNSLFKQTQYLIVEDQNAKDIYKVQPVADNQHYFHIDQTNNQPQNFNKSKRISSKQNLQTKKSSINQNHTPIILECQYFQISVQNYMDPLEFLKTRLTSQIKIKRQLQSIKISFNNQGAPTNYRPYLNILRRLKVSYTRKRYLDQLLKFLPECQNLEELTICEPLLGTSEIINFIIISLPKLRSLEFLCNNKLSHQHLDLIVEYLPNLEELYYGPKCYNNIALKSEYRQFRQHKKQKRLSSLENKRMKDFMQKVSSIKNIWISEDQGVEEILELLTRKQNLQHLIIGRYTTDSTVVESTLQLSPQCWVSLTQLTSLHSLALINIHIDETSLAMILNRNSATLASLEIYACANWTDELASKLRYCRALKEFYLFGSDQSIFKGATLWEAVTLQTLVLRSCQFMDQSSAQKKIGKLSQLKHIDVLGCQWFNDTILAQLVKNKYLTFLNLANTQIGSLFQNHLRSLFKIRCLALGSTRINAAAIQQLCNEFPDLEKLSLYNLCGSAVVNGRCMVKKNRLNKIGDILRNLKYLDVASLNTADDTLFDHFKTIKSIYLWMATSISKKKIQQMHDKGMNIVDDA